MKLYLLPIFAVFILVASVRAQQQPSLKSLRTRIDNYVKDKRASVGVAVLTEQDEMMEYRSPLHYPLLSVFKLHVALAVLDRMSSHNLALDTPLPISKTELRADTYSPLRDKFPNQNFIISVKELLQYSISLSDNNACDILINLAGGIEYINDYIQQLGIRSCHLSKTEADMHHDINNSQYCNWSSPCEVVSLLKMVDEKELFAKEYKDFLWQALIETRTGADKLKAQLPRNLVVGHKTGSSDRTADGKKIADNDAGFIVLPDGRKYYIAVFVMNSYETDDENARIIATISRMVYDTLK